MGVPNASIPPTSALAMPSFRQWRDSRLQELIRRQPEEIRDAVEVFQGNFTLVGLENLGNPTLRAVAPLCQVLACLPASAQQRVDVVLQKRVGLHT